MQVLYIKGETVKVKHTFVVLAYKESKYLERCIKSVKNQDYASDVVIATSTPNEFIYSLAEKYNVEVKVNPEPGKGIGYDFDFAERCVDSTIVTIAHQDDIYDNDYSAEIVKAYQKDPRAIIIFSDYYEIRNQEKVYANTNLKIKRILLIPLRIPGIKKTYMAKRMVLALGNSICCPAVSFVKHNINRESIFASHMKCNVDWLGWERLSREKGYFIFVNKYLMGHRIHEDSTTTDIIKDNIRTIEDREMFSKFWPQCIVNILNRFYIKSEKSNRVRGEQ